MRISSSGFVSVGAGGVEEFFRLFDDGACEDGHARQQGSGATASAQAADLDELTASRSAAHPAIRCAASSGFSGRRGSSNDEIV